MRKAVKLGRKVDIIEDSLPAPHNGHVRLRVEACGVCGTDLHDNAPGDEGEPKGFGHEMAGTVLELGPGVETLQVGDRVTVESSCPCGHCAACHNGQQELCAAAISFWPTGQFGFQEETLVPAVTALPAAGLTADVACLAEPLGVAIDMVRLAEVGMDDNVLILGPGGIGLMALALCKRAGARRTFVWGRTQRRARIELARRWGADEVLDAAEVDLASHDFGCPITRVLVTAPPRFLPGAMAAAGKGGILSYIGIEWGPAGNITFDANAFHFKKLQLRASFASPALYTPQAIQYLQEGVVDGEALISHRYPLAEIQAALETARQAPDAIKVVVNP